MRRGLQVMALGLGPCFLLGCNAVLGIDDLPTAGDGGAKDAASDTSAHDATHRDAQKDASTRSDARDAVAARDVVAEAAPCTSQCTAEGGIAACTDGKPLTMQCEAGSVCIAGDAGPACSPEWPNAATPCSVGAGQTLAVRVGSTLSCASLTIADGGTLELVPPESWDGGAMAPDAGMAWTIVGVAGDAVINGAIVGQWVGDGVTTLVVATAPAKNGADGGEALSFAAAQAAGGGGGPGGFPPGDCFASEGGAPAFGNGGGGGGSGAVETYNGTALYNICASGYCTTSGSSFGSGAPGGPATATTGGTGGKGKNGQVVGTTQTVGNGGTALAPNAAPLPVTSVSGAGGGFRGKNGSLLLLVVKGSLRVTGVINLSGEIGGTGANGGSPTVESGFLDNGDCVDQAGGPQYGYVSGGAGGGGGAGGAGGALLVRVGGDAGSLAGHVFVDGGAAGGGGGSVVEGSGGRTGSPGSAGVVDIARY